MRPTRRALLGGLAGGVAALAGCGYRPVGGERRWSRPVEGFGSANEVLFDGGRLLVVVRETRGFDFESEEWRRGGQLTVVEPTAGEAAGSHLFGEPMVAGAHDGETAYAVFADGSVRVAPIPDQGSSATTDATGGGEWTARPEVAGEAATLAAGSRVYVAGNGGLAAIAPSDGAVAWRWTGGAVRTVVPGRDATAYAVTDDELLGLGADGTVRWRRRASSDEPPVVDGAGVYLADGERLVALTHDGRERWSRAVGDSLGGPVLSGGRLYHVSDGGVRSFAPDGRERWRTEVPIGVVSGVAAGNDRVFVRYDDALAGVGSEGVAWRVEVDVFREFDPAFGPFATGDVVVLAGGSELRGYWQSQLPRDGGLL